MKNSHTSLSESLSSSNASSRPLSTTHSATDNNLTSSVSSISSFQSREQSLNSSGASHNLTTEHKALAGGRSTNDVKRAAYANLQAKPAMFEEGTIAHPDSYDRNRRMPVSPPLADRYAFKQFQQATRQVTQNPNLISNRGPQRLAANSCACAEPYVHYTPLQEDEDPLIFAMNDMEHHL
jgi:hypothetical protein